MTTILVADDDPSITNMLRRTFAYEGYKVVTAADGREALTQARTHLPDLIVLDWRMPKHDGMDVLHRIRSIDPTPVLMLTARDGVADRITGLDGGADDYLVKPFDSGDLLARVRALLRRAEPTSDQRPLTYGDLVLDPVTYKTRRGDRDFSLTKTEFDLLAYLLRHAEQVLPRSRILDAVWGDDFFGDDNVIEVYVRYLRVKTEAGEPRLIQTVRGVGYVLRAE